MHTELIGKNVAVQFNEQNKGFVIRRMNVRAFSDFGDEQIILNDVTFLNHSEIRGVVSSASPIVKAMDPVFYKPHERPDFHDVSGDTVTESKTVLISSKLGIFKYDYLAL